ncbi:MAG: hypothetical protein HY815_06895 [Candidatus Riflebacteria bacterium]|nr:hypothetical protein [Candidatus Riflebacteria bacterium]
MFLGLGRFVGASVIVLAAFTQVHGFSGSGKEGWDEAQKYLGRGRMSQDEAAKIQEMTEADRLQKAADLLVDAERSASTEHETQTVGQALATVYNRLALDCHTKKDLKNAVYYGGEAVKRDGADPTLHANLGQYQIDAGEYYEASRSLTKARDVAKDPVAKQKAWKTLIAAYMRQAQNSDQRARDDAIREIGGLLAEQGDDFDALWRLGLCWRLKGDAARALDAWEKARKAGQVNPDQEREYQNLKAAKTIKADKQFVKDSSMHFSIEFNDKSQSALAQKVLGMLDEAYEEVGTRFDLRPDKKVFVTVYTGQEYNDVFQVSWAGGQHEENRIDLKVNPAMPEAKLRDVILHEWTHHVVSLKSRQQFVPLWIHEGLAMHCERNHEAGTAPVLALLDRVIKVKNNYIPFKDDRYQIHRSFMKLPNPNLVRLAYAQSYSIVHKMIDRFGFGTVVKVVERLGAGEEFESAFHVVTRVKWEDFEKEWFQERRAAAALVPEPTPGPGMPAQPVVAPAAGQQGGLTIRIGSPGSMPRPARTGQ